jgi:hypothetical protein
MGDRHELARTGQRLSPPLIQPYLCKYQEFRSKTRPVKTGAFFCAKHMHIIDPMKYGYARVSTDGQSVDAQVRQL